MYHWLSRRSWPNGLGVSERTAYRDIRDLILAGTLIDGEAGVGYRIHPGYDLPPPHVRPRQIQLERTARDQRFTRECQCGGGCSRADRRRHEQPRLGHERREIFRTIAATLPRIAWLARASEGSPN
jgi:hypothetical protein